MLATVVMELVVLIMLLAAAEAVEVTADKAAEAEMLPFMVPVLHQAAVVAEVDTAQQVVQAVMETMDTTIRQLVAEVEVATVELVEQVHLVVH